MMHADLHIDVGSWENFSIFLLYLELYFTTRKNEQDRKSEAFQNSRRRVSESFIGEERRWKAKNVYTRITSLLQNIFIHSKLFTIIFLYGCIDFGPILAISCLAIIFFSTGSSFFSYAYSNSGSSSSFAELRSLESPLTQHPHLRPFFFFS